MPAIRYVGVFHDRGRFLAGGLESDAEAFFSLRDAAEKMRARVKSNGNRCAVDYPVWCDGRAATHMCKPETELFFEVTEQAYIDLYRLMPDAGHKGWATVGEPAYRITLGTRLGIHYERH